MPLEYLPFAVGSLKLPRPQCNALLDGTAPKRLGKLSRVCGLVVRHGYDGSGARGGADSCTCWLNLPTFKSNSLFIRVLDTVAGIIKVPSRVTTYLEMALHSTRGAHDHVQPLARFAPRHDARLQPNGEIGMVRVRACASPTARARAVRVRRERQLEQFNGRPPSVAEVRPRSTITRRVVKRDPTPIPSPAERGDLTRAPFRRCAPPRVLRSGRPAPT